MRKTLCSLAILVILGSGLQAQQRFEPTQLTQVDAHSSFGVWSFMYDQTLYTGHKQNRTFFSTQQNGRWLVDYKRAHRPKVWGDITGFTGGVLVGLGGLLIMDDDTRRDGFGVLGVGAVFLAGSALLERSANRKLARILKGFNENRGGLGISTGRSLNQYQAGLRVRL